MWFRGVRSRFGAGTKYASLVLAAFLILFGITPLLDLQSNTMLLIQQILAIAAGVLLILDR